MSGDKSDRWIGETVGGRYRIDRKIAEGGMGAVYEARDLKDDRWVAVKLLHAHLAKDEQIVERFRREALAATAIGDPHIVEVIEFGAHDDEGVFMAMELLGGLDLAKLIKTEGPLPIGRTIRIAMQIADALGRAHAKGIVHRDLKPENVVLIDKDGDSDFVKVLDFGVSKLVLAIEGVAQPSATRTGTTLGTPHYMPPEQAQAKKDLDHRVDVYALGVILFRALTGQHPFDDESFPILVIKICTDPPPPLRTWRRDVPRDLEQVIERMLAKDREERYDSMRSACEALAPFAALDEAPDVIEGAPSTTERRAGVLATDPSLADPAARTAPAVDVAPGPESDLPPRPARPFPMWIVALALPLLALVAWLAFAFSKDDAPAEALPALPEPHPPRTTAMVATSDGHGWTWVNPIPRAMPTWFAVDVASGGDPVVLVGRGGRAVRYARGTLYSWRTGVERDLLGVAWTSAREAIAVGEGGTIVRLTGEGPHRVASGTDVTLRDVVAISPTEAIAVGDRGTVLRIRGERASALHLDTRTDLFAAYARGEDVLIVGARGTALRLTGNTVTRQATGARTALRGVGGCPGDDLYAAGEGGTLLRLHAGSWSRVRVRSRAMFTGVSCDHGRVAGVLNDGSIVLVSGTRTLELPSDFTRPWHAVSGGVRGSSWIVGEAGRLATIEEDHLRTRTAGPRVPIRAMGSMGGALVLVGEWGRILRERSWGLEQVDSPTDAGLAALVQLGEGRLLAIGDFGVMLDVRFDRASVIESPTRASLRSGVVRDNELLLVGAEGVIVRGAPGLWQSSRLEGVGDLWSVAGTPEDATVVGDDGVVLHVSPSGNRELCARSTTLRSVVQNAGGAWAAGDGGRIVRVTADGCVEEHRGGGVLHAIGFGPEGALIAAGDDGVVLARREDGTWAPEGVDVAGASVRTIWRDERYVYLAGTDGVLVRHVRVDGS